MTTTLPSGRKRSRFPLDWSAAFTLSARSGALDALSSQVATFTRAATLAGLDSNGASVTFAYGQPAYEWVNLLSDGVMVPGLLLSTSDRLYLARNQSPPDARTWYIDLTDKTATGAANGTRIFEVGDSSGNDFVSVQRSAGGYSALHRNGTTTVTATATVTIASGDRARIRVTLLSTGAIAIFCAKNTAAEASDGATGANTLDSLWSGARLAIGADYAGNNRATQNVRLLREMPGTQTATFMAAG